MTQQNALEYLKSQIKAVKVNLLNKKPQKCSWTGFKFPVFSDTNQEYSINVFDDNYYDDYSKLEKTITDYNAIVQDTSKIQVIDFDMLDDSELIEKLKVRLPYYFSMNKGMPHFICKIPDLGQTKCIGFNTKKCPEKQGDILNTQWAYMGKDTVLYNPMPEIPTYDLFKEGDIEIFKKHTKPTNLKSKESENRKLVKELSKIIDLDRYVHSGTHDNYIKLIWSLHDYKDIAYELTEKSNSKTKLNEFEDLFADYDPDRGYSILNFYEFCRDSNFESYYKIRAKYKVVPPLTEILDEESCAEAIFAQYGDYYLLSEDIVYHWDEGLFGYERNNRWFKESINKARKARGLFAKIISNWRSYHKNKFYENKAKASKEEKQALIKEEKLIMKQYKRLGDKTTLYAIWCLFLDKLALRVDQINFDQRPELIAFNNMVYDFSDNKFKPQTKEMYLSQNTEFDWVDPTDSEMNDVHKMINKIFYNNKDSEITYMSALKNALTGWCPEVFVILQGDGRQGKGVMNELLRLILNEKGRYGYSFKGTVKTLYQSLGDGANPNVAGIGNKRFVVFSEPNDGQTLCVATIKELTGGGQICARDIYSSDTQKNLNGIVVLETNKKLLLDEDGTDKACITERFINIQLKSVFKDEFTQDNYETCEFMLDEELKTPKWQASHRCAFFKYIVDYKDPENKIPSTGQRVYVTPKIKEETKAILGESDFWKEFIEEKIEIGNPHPSNYKCPNGKTSDRYFQSKQDLDFIQIKDIFQEFLQSPMYDNLKKQGRGMITAKNLKEKLKNHSEYKKYFVDTQTFKYHIWSAANGKYIEYRCKNVMRPWRWAKDETPFDDTVSIISDELDN